MWDVASNRKEFFDKFAVSKGLDPLRASDWYQVSQQDILDAKVENKAKEKNKEKEKNRNKEK
jgi:hypothetical protein